MTSKEKKAALAISGRQERPAHLRARTADLTHVAIVDLGRFGRLFGSQLFVLESRLLGEGAAGPGCRGRHGRHRLLLLLLLLVVVGGCRVHGRFVARVRGS